MYSIHHISSTTTTTNSTHQNDAHTYFIAYYENAKSEYSTRQCASNAPIDCNK